MAALGETLARWWSRWRYNRYWRSRPAAWSYGIHIVEHALETGSYRTILDAGCGRGDVVAHLLDRGFEARGIEISDYAVKHSAAPAGAIAQGDLAQLPFPDRHFDLVFSSEVLEHIPADHVPAVVSELVRVCRERLFLTISLRPSSQHNAFHPTLRPRRWWEAQFVAAGVRPNRAAVDRWQNRGPFTNREILERGPTAAILDELEDFMRDEPYSFDGELEPWYFVFDR